jgi:tetratricopeptide repeat protein 30
LELIPLPLFCCCCAVLMSLAQLHWEAGAYGRVQEVLHQSAEFCSDHPAWRLNLAHALVAQEGAAAAGGASAGSQGRLGQAAELYESLLQHFAGREGGSLLEAPPSAVANLCVCYVAGAQNEVAEDLLRRLEDEVAAAQAAGQPPPPHLSLTNLALGTLYCAKGGWGGAGMG